MCTNLDTGQFDLASFSLSVLTYNEMTIIGKTTETAWVT